MKVGVVTCSISRQSGGLLDAVRDLYKKINLKDIDLTVYSFWDTDTKSDLPSWEPLFVRLFKRENSFFYSKSIKETILNSEIEILHVHGLWRYHHVLINKWRRQGKGISIITPHGMLDPYIVKNQGFLKRGVGFFLFSRKAFNRIDCYVALCYPEYEAIRNYGIKAPIAIIPNGINLSENNIVVEKDNKKHLLFLGRLHPKKGVDMFLEAIGLLSEKNTNVLEDWLIDIVGWSQEGFDKKLLAIVKKYNIENKVVFHGGVYGVEKEKLYVRADGYILPSHGEGLPMTVLEAWSNKVPVIMTPLCNIPEGFEANAAIKIENNVNSVLKGLTTFFEMTDEDRCLLGERGYLLVKEKFTWEASAKKLEELYVWLADKERKKPSFIVE